MEQEVLLQEEIIETEEKSYQEYPMVALRGLVVFPHMNLNFDVSRKMSVMAVEEAMTEGQVLFLTKQKYVSTEDPREEDLEKVGTLVRIRQISKLSNHNLRVLVEGMERCVLQSAELTNGYLSAKVEPCGEESEEELDDNMREAMLRQLENGLAEYLRFYPKAGKGIVEYMEKASHIGQTADFIAITLPLPIDKKQRILNHLNYKSL